ncbi:hypothetical protein RWE15_22380 [Virgibacillus halophilus]|uniref:Uncharacterized protein n=2 Tax=Tigheibacillus halophilus TaxID=361280 RepID=A0ABU5CB64_9BACI|nr:hypothetical protein [Virgibacillus halophilus]
MWLIMPKSLFLPLIIVTIILYVAKGLMKRVAIAVVGVCGGDLFYGVMLSSYHIPYTAGSKAFLDDFVVIVAVIICLQILHEMYSYGMKLLHKHTTAPAILEQRKKDAR